MSALRSFIVSFLALTLSLWLLPGVQVNRGSESVATLAVVVLAVGALLRPLLTRLTVLTGTIGLLVAGLLAQALILGIALNLVHGAALLARRDLRGLVGCGSGGGRRQLDL